MAHGVPSGAQKIIENPFTVVIEFIKALGDDILKNTVRSSFDGKVQNHFQMLCNERPV